MEPPENENMWSRLRIRQQDPLMGKSFVRGDRSYTLGATMENKQTPTFLPGLKRAVEIVCSGPARLSLRQGGAGKVVTG